MIKERFGHTDIRITLNTYGHLYPDQQKVVADMLDDENIKARKYEQPEQCDKWGRIHKCQP